MIALAALSSVSWAEPATEVCRIRVENRPGGLVQVSLDRGQSYQAVGQVTHPANARIIGFGAASYTPDGTVAATAVHGIRIKTGRETLKTGKAQMPLMFSIVPSQFAKLPKGYGGHIPRSSAIVTDIPAGHAIFRNQSPYVGNPVFVEREHSLRPMPEDYTPAVGDTFVILVQRPERMPVSIEFENRGGGEVTEHFADGTSQVIARVLRPVRGTGRYDGTTYTGVGAINTNHGGVITISTAPNSPSNTPEGGPDETRGGFMIQPYFHVCEQNETSPQVMVVGALDRSRPHLEGAAPLFEGYINLTRYREKPELSYRAEIKLDGGDWEPAPKLIGKIDNAFTATFLTDYFARQGTCRELKQGVTAVRLLFPEPDEKLLAQDLSAERESCSQRAIVKGTRPRKGTFALTTRRRLAPGSMVDFYVDGAKVYSSNNPPYEFAWDSTTAANGFHSIEIESDGPRPYREVRAVLVVN